VHTPLTHEVVPLEFVQAVPQAPQLVTLVVRSTSHPLDAMPSQLAQPLAQVPSWQEPPKQVALAWANAQAVVQVPQWRASVLRLTSQPFDTRPSQLP
jgi:hypothetical protein